MSAKGFKFKYDVLVKLRKQKEDISTINLSKSKKDFQDAVDYKNKLENELVEHYEKIENLKLKKIKISNLKIEYDYIIYLNQKIIKSEKNILKAQRQLEKSKIVYFLARKDYKMMRVLKDDAELLHGKNTNKIENKKNEDHINMRYKTKRIVV